MNRISRRATLTALAAAGIGSAAGIARGADWPTRPVSWIVPFPPGGGSDLFARPIAAHVGDRLGQPMVIDSRPGAGGTIGTAIAARAGLDADEASAVLYDGRYADVVRAEAAEWRAKLK